ncbi:mevalonate kinase [Lasius niger]|uniref:mevalonate kinase n=1 Tax=Lasius niger TaxID=67767 RepID=A0A0J7KMP3_LASNI|nr:mevalonate kinase [Lasius niger]
MIEFKVSAPGRIVLWGEHAVLYGKECVHASLNLRTTVKFLELNDQRDNIYIEFPDVGLSLKLPLQLLLNFISGDNFIHVAEDNILLLRDVQYFITLNGMWSTYAQKFSLQTFFFLLLYISHHEELDIKPFHVHVSTELPIGAGLGSSSSFAVCLAACFLHWARLQRGAHYAFSEYELAKISEYASSCEELLQNCMFKMDSDACTYGKILRFQFNKERQFYHTLILNVPRMKILLIDSRVRKNKREQIGRMAEMMYCFPRTVNITLNTIDHITRAACHILVAINNNYRDNNLRQLQASYISLGIFIQLNQTMLCNLSLSHPNLNIICLIAQCYGFAGKLTGFGGGGYAYVLLPPAIPEECIKNLLQHLMAEHFINKRAYISCNGVRIEN